MQQFGDCFAFKNTCVVTFVWLSMTSMSSSSSAKLGNDIPISTLPLPLSCTVNSLDSPIAKTMSLFLEEEQQTHIKNRSFTSRPA